MDIISFDTLEYAKNLEAKGFTTEQSEALAEENKRVFNEFADTQLATKADLFMVKEELKADITDVKSDITGLKSDITGLKSDIKITHWGIALLLVVIGIPAIKALFSV